MTITRLTAEQAQRREREYRQFKEIERKIETRPKVTKGRDPRARMEIKRHVVEKFIKPKDISPEALKKKQILVRKWGKKDLPKWVTDFMGDPLKLSDSERKLVLPFYGKSSTDALKQKGAMTSYLNYVSKEVKKNPAKAVLFAALPPAFKIAGRGIRATGITRLITTIPHGETISKRSLQLVSAGVGAVYSKDIHNRVTEPVFSGYKDGKSTTSQRTLPNGDIEITTTTKQIPQYRKPTGPEQHERIGGIFAIELAPLAISQRIISRGVKTGYKPQPKPKPKVKVTTTIKRAGKIIKTLPKKIKKVPSKVKTKAQKAKEARDIKKRHEKAAKAMKAKKEAELKRKGIKPKTKAQKAKEAREIKKRHEKSAKVRLEKQKRLGITPKTKAQRAKEHAILKELHTKAAKSRLKTQQVKKHIESSKRLNLTRYKRLNKLIYKLNGTLDRLEMLIKKAMSMYRKLTLKDRKKQKKTFENLKRHMKNVKETRRELGVFKSELTKAKKHHDTRIKPGAIGKSRVGPRRTREAIRRERIKEEKARREFDEEVKRIAEIEFDKKLTLLEKQDKYFHSKQGKMDAAIEFTEMTASNYGRTFKLIEPLPKPLPKGTYIVKGMTKAEKHAILKARVEKAARERAKIRAAELKARGIKVKTPTEITKEHVKMRASLVKAGKIKIETKKLPAKKRVDKDQETSKIIKTQTESGTVMLERVKTKVRQHEKAAHATAKEATKTKVKTATKTKLKQIESTTRTQHKQLTVLYKSMVRLGITYRLMLKVANTTQQKQKIRTQIRYIETEKERIKELISETWITNRLITVAIKERLRTITRVEPIPRVKPIPRPRIIKPVVVPPVIVPIIPAIPLKRKVKPKKKKKMTDAQYRDWFVKNEIPTLKSLYG